MNETTPVVLEAVGLVKTFADVGRKIEVLRGVELKVAKGDRVAIIGASGSGKTTLLQLLGGLDEPTTGEVRVAGESMSRASDVERGRLRNRALGFVYQFHHLLPEFSALDNVALPQMIAGKTRKAAEDRAAQLLGDLGLAERTGHQPAQLSGGEQQRVAVARALANSPRLLLADEPTGNLDPHTSTAVFDNLYGLVRQTGVAALIATHNMELARHMDRVFTLKDGHLEPLAAS
jgi:lipoprotein-releasing system ATP-binding protein